MTEYIDREALYEKAYWHGEHPDVGNPFPDGVDAIDIKDVDAIPAADVRPVVRGRWVWKGQDKGFECDQCHGRCLLNYESDWHKSDFCPHCGADMRGGEEE